MATEKAKAETKSTDNTEMAKLISENEKLIKKNAVLVSANDELTVVNLEMESQIGKLVTKVQDLTQESKDLTFQLKKSSEENVNLKNQEMKIAEEKGKNQGKMKTYQIIAEGGAQFRNADGLVDFAGTGEIITTTFVFDPAIAKIIRSGKVEEVELPS